MGELTLINQKESQSNVFKNCFPTTPVYYCGQQANYGLVPVL